MTGKPKNLTLSSIGIVLHRVVWPTTKHVQLYRPVVQCGSLLNRLYYVAKQLVMKQAVRELMGHEPFGITSWFVRKQSKITKNH